MPLKFVVFALVLFGSLAYAGWRGRAPERLTAALFLLAAVGTGLLPQNDGTHFERFYTQDFFVDAVLLLALVPIALRANRFWPLWVVSLQFLTLGIHMVKAYDPLVLPIVYAWAASKMAYPMLGLLAAGTWRLRARIHAHGAEDDWSPLRW
jgi:hypothetical protein